MIHTTDIITWEKMEQQGITLRNVLEKSNYCKTAMKRFGIKHYSVIENAIKALQIVPSRLFSYNSYKHGLFVTDDGQTSYYDSCNRMHTIKCAIYLGDYQYAQLAWNDIYYLLFKRYYPTLYKTFLTETPYEINLNDAINKIPYFVNYQNMTIKEFLRFIKKKNKVKTSSRFKLYSESSESNLFFLELLNEEGEHSIYLTYEDLLDIKNNKNFDEVWERIQERKWYMKEKQGDTTWFDCKTTQALKTIFLEMSKGNVK